MQPICHQSNPHETIQCCSSNEVQEERSSQWGSSADSDSGSVDKHGATIMIQHVAVRQESHLQQQQADVSESGINSYLPSWVLSIRSARCCRVYNSGIHTVTVADHVEAALILNKI